jgi:SynChlorMet cassette protein ScmD
MRAHIDLGEKSMTRSGKPTANSLLVLREEFDDWAVLYDPDSGKGFGLNPVSAFIWKRLDGRHTLKDIVTELEGQFGEVPPEAEEHVNEFVAELVERGFAGYEIE